MNDGKFDQIRRKMLEHIRHTMEYCGDVTEEEFLSNRMLQEACIFNVLQVGELAAKVIEYHLDQEHPEMMWRQMRGMRNRIVHDYEGIRLGIVWDTIQHDFPDLLRKLQ